MLDVACTPAALGIAALVLAVVSLTIVDPASEIGAIHYYLGGVFKGGGIPLVEYRWAAGLRLALALVAAGLAIGGIRLLLGPRPRLTVGVDDLDADPETLDAMEAQVIAEAASAPPTWMMSILGSGLLVSVISIAMNGAALIYALASHAPPSTNSSF